MNYFDGYIYLNNFVHSRLDKWKEIQLQNWLFNVEAINFLDADSIEEYLSSSYLAVN